MKKIFIVLLIFLTKCGINSLALEISNPEEYGKILNLSAGIGYCSYMGNLRPVAHIDYEFEMSEYFTIAPFMNIHSNSRLYCWSRKNYQYLFNNNKEIIIPLGVKGSYYFGKLLGIGSDWDFYAGGSVVFAMINSSSFGEKTVYHAASPIYFDMHMGAKYRLNYETSLFLDISSGISAFGLSVNI